MQRALGTPEMPEQQDCAHARGKLQAFECTSYSNLVYPGPYLAFWKSTTCCMCMRHHDALQLRCTRRHCLETVALAAVDLGGGVPCPFPDAFGSVQCATRRGRVANFDYQRK